MSSKSETPEQERRGQTIQRFAKKWGISESFVKRAISHGRIKTIPFGDRSIVPPEEDERIGREGVPNVPAGYKRKTVGPWPGGRPAKAAKKKGKAQRGRSEQRVASS